MTTAWDGQGLPPAAEARMERGRQGGPGASLFGISGQAALEACGFSAVGEVMGCIVQHIGFSGYGGCGAYVGGGGLGSAQFGGSYGPGMQHTGYASQPSVRTSSQGGTSGFAPYVDAIYHGYDTAMLRMLLECRDLRGDGVVGVSLTQKDVGEGNREFLAYGTAVRAHTKTRPAAIFSTMLPAHDVAKLLHGGWVPAGVAIGISLGIRHDDYYTRMEARAWGNNTEVSGYTQLVNQVRHDARQEFRRRVAALGAEVAILSDSSLDIWEVEPAENHRDHAALASVLGTSISRFHASDRAPTKSLSILLLNDRQPTPKRRTR